MVLRASSARSWQKHLDADVKEAWIPPHCLRDISPHDGTSTIGGSEAWTATGSVVRDDLDQSDILWPGNGPVPAQRNFLLKTAKKAFAVTVHVGAPRGLIQAGMQIDHRPLPPTDPLKHLTVHLSVANAVVEQPVRRRVGAIQTLLHS